CGSARTRGARVLSKADHPRERAPLFPLRGRRTQPKAFVVLLPADARHRDAAMEPGPAGGTVAWGLGGHPDGPEVGILRLPPDLVYDRLPRLHGGLWEAHELLAATLPCRSVARRP